MDNYIIFKRKDGDTDNIRDKSIKTGESMVW